MMRLRSRIPATGARLSQHRSFRQSDLDCLVSLSFLPVLGVPSALAG